MPDTIVQAVNNNWLRERWFRLTTSECKEAIGCKSERAVSIFLLSRCGRKIVRILLQWSMKRNMKMRHLPLMPKTCHKKIMKHPR